MMRTYLADSTCNTGALIILPTSELYKEERAFDAIVVYPILYDAKMAVIIKRRGGNNLKKKSSLNLIPARGSCLLDN